MNMPILTQFNQQPQMTSPELVEFINHYRKEVATPEKPCILLRHDHFMAKFPQVLSEKVAPNFLETSFYQGNGSAQGGRQINVFPNRLSQARKLLSVNCQPAPKKKKSKYGNSSAIVDDLEFDSWKEARRYRELKILEQKVEIQDLQTQYAFVLAESVKSSNEPRRRTAVKYLADFVYIKDGQKIVEDVKSETTKKLAVYRLKKHLMMSSLDGSEIRQI